MHNDSHIFQNGFFGTNNNYLHSLRSSRCFNKKVIMASTGEYKTEESIFPQTQKKIFAQTQTPKKKQECGFTQSKEMTMTTGFKNEFCFNWNIFTNFANEKDWYNKENSNIPSNFFFTTSEETENRSKEGFFTNSFKFQIKKDRNENLLNSCKINQQQRFSTDRGESHFWQVKDEAYHNRLIQNSTSSSSSSKGNSTFSTDNNQTSTNGFNGNHMEQSKTLIPKEKRNDENYKLLAIRKIRKPIFKNNKSTSKYETSDGITSQANPYLINFEHQQMNSTGTSNSLYDYNILSGKRKKVVHSVKKYYASEIEFHDSATKKKFCFNIYKDNEIGINLEWQRYLHECKEDEDIASDEEMINNGGKFCRNEMQRAMHSVQSGEGFHQIVNIQFL